MDLNLFYKKNKAKIDFFIKKNQYQHTPTYVLEEIRQAVLIKLFQYYHDASEQECQKLLSFICYSCTKQYYREQHSPKAKIVKGPSLSEGPIQHYIENKNSYQLDDYHTEKEIKIINYYTNLIHKHKSLEHATIFKAHLEGSSYKHMAQDFNIKMSTVKRLIHQSRTTIKKLREEGKLKEPSDF